MAIENDVTAPEDEEEEEEADNGEASGEGQNGKEGDGRQKREPEAPEARKARLDRELARHQKKHPELYKAKEEKAEEKPADGKESKLDYGQKAYLTANDIKAKDEQALALRIMTETTQELEDILTGPYFKAELKALREKNAAEDADPGNRRSKASSPSSVEYWIAKGGLPPDTADNRDLRTKIVNARMRKEKDGSHFTDHAVAGRG